MIERTMDVLLYTMTFVGLPCPADGETALCRFCNFVKNKRFDL